LLALLQHRQQQLLWQPSRPRLPSRQWRSPHKKIPPLQYQRGHLQSTHRPRLPRVQVRSHLRWCCKRWLRSRPQLCSQLALHQTLVQRPHHLPHLRTQLHKVQPHKLQPRNRPQPLHRFRLCRLQLRSQWQPHTSPVVLQHHHHLHPVNGRLLTLWRHHLHHHSRTLLHSRQCLRNRLRLHSRLLLSTKPWPRSRPQLHNRPRPHTMLALLQGPRRKRLRYTKFKKPSALHRDDQSLITAAP